MRRLGFTDGSHEGSRGFGVEGLGFCRRVL